jgi:hypothetical protein
VVSVADRLRDALVEAGIIPNAIDDQNPSPGEGHGFEVTVTLSAVDADRLADLLNERLPQ